MRRDSYANDRKRDPIGGRAEAPRLNRPQRNTGNGLSSPVRGEKRS